MLLTAMHFHTGVPKPNLFLYVHSWQLSLLPTAR